MSRGERLTFSHHREIVGRTAILVSAVLGLVTSLPHISRAIGLAW